MSAQARSAAATLQKVVRGTTAGLIAGVVASFAMDGFQAIASQLTGSGDDGGEPATAKAADKVKIAATGTPVAKADQPLAGQIVHYALGAGLGIAYGIAAEFKPHVTAGYGAAFGIGVAATLDEAVVPAVGLGDAPWHSDATTTVYSLLSHLVFGTVAELTRRRVRSTLLPA